MTNDTSIQLPGNARTELRAAVRTAMTDPLTPEWRLKPVIAMLNGRKINDLTKAELISAAHGLDVDVRDIIETASQTEKQSRPLGVGVDAVSPAPRDRDRDIEVVDGDGDAEHSAPTIEHEASELRRNLAMAMVEGDFSTVTNTITDLLTAARKPAEVKVIEKIVKEVETKTVYVREGDVIPTDAVVTSQMTRAAAHVPAPVGSVSYANAFGLSGAWGRKQVHTYAPHPTTPAIDARYRWPENVTKAALAAFGRGRHVWMFGPAGTGKTSFAEQLAARTGRPFFLIPFDDTTEAPELVGMTVPHQGAVRWQDGVLTAAIRVPHTIILLDELTVARAGAVMVLQSVLASGVLSIKETGELVRVAEGVRFIAADNTNGTGGGSAEGYEATRRMNAATLNRFAQFLRVDYMEPSEEAAALVAHTSCTPELANILVECAGLAREARVSHAMGLRRLIAWAEALTDGLDPRHALEVAVLNACSKEDREPTEQCCALGLNASKVRLALKGVSPDPLADNANPPPPQSRAAADFADVDA